MKVLFNVLLFVLLFVLITPNANTSAKIKEDYAYISLDDREVGKVVLYNNHAQVIYPEKVDGYDLRLLAEVMYHENGMNGRYCMYLTGAVVINRVLHDRYPNSVHEVLYQKGQYATTGKFFTKTIPTEVYEIAREVLMYQAYDVPRNVIYQSMHKSYGSGIYKAIPSSYAPTRDIEYFNYE